MKRWANELLTDSQGAPDTGRVASLLVIIAMVALSAYDVVAHGAPFHAQELGLGVGAVLGGMGGYLWGDARRPPALPGSSGATTTTTL